MDTLTDHEQAHRAAFLRARRIQIVASVGWLTAGCLALTTLTTGRFGWLWLAAAVVVALLVWRRYGHRDTAEVREVTACRFEYAADRTRQYADHIGPHPDPDAAPHQAELCARIDRIEATLPWWVRTGS